MTELLAPAGNIEALDAALGEGADAVYLGLKNFNARLRSTNFAWNQFQAAVAAVHKMHKKIYVTVNTVCEERELGQLYELLAYLDKVHPDGIIVQDFATIRMAQEFFPDLEIHASTQMNVASARGVNMLARNGVKRVVLARELGLEEIASIREQTTAQLEVFVHGALCVSESGLCMFSSFLGGKSANRGMCTQACRRLYTADTTGGEREGYFFSPCDLQLIDEIPDLIKAGVESFKIEGRMKSAEYVGSVVAAYRYVIDHYAENRKEAVAAAKRMLATDFARAKTSYWYDFKNESDAIEKAGQAILNPDQAGGTGIYLGKIITVQRMLLREMSHEYRDAGKESLLMARVRGGNYEPDPGDSIRLHRHDDSGRESHKVKIVYTDKSGRRWIDIPNGFETDDEVYLLQTKSMGKRYKRVLPDSLERYNLQPRKLDLPVLDLTAVADGELKFFPEGVYAQVSSITDAFTAQGINPVRLVLELNAETQYDLLNHKTVLPFSKKQIFISLDPFCPAAKENDLANTLDSLLQDGFDQFVVNNLAHISMLRGKTKKIIAGPYLYTFNRWAVSFLENQDVSAFVMPYENSRKNLEASFVPSVRARVMVPVFAYPKLFRMRFRSPSEYNFTEFFDKAETSFRLVSTAENSCVVPEFPFSILDKTPLLAQNGFTRYLVDFSHAKLNKAMIKNVIHSLSKASPLANTYRFNWKEGFYVDTEMFGSGKKKTTPASSKAYTKNKRK